MNILDTFLQVAAAAGERWAIIEPSGRRITYAEIVDASAHVAAKWQADGLVRGARVLVAMPLGIDLYIGLAALWRIGAVAVFPEPALGLKGLRNAIRATQPTAYLTGGYYAALKLLMPALWRTRTLRVTRAGPRAVAAPADVEGDAPALISFTSGSTGTPKGIVRSHAFLAAQNARVAELLASETPQTDLVAFPVFVIANLSLGNTSVLPNWPLRQQDRAEGPDVIRYAAERQVTRALLPPSLCEILAATGRALPFHTIFTGGGPVFPDIVAPLVGATPGLRVVSVYGSTEAEPIAHLEAAALAPADLATMRAGGGLLAGRPIDHIRLALIDDEIVVAGAHVNTGYLDPAQDATTKLHREGAIWHRTGDAGRLDADGRLWLLGRLDGRVGDLFPFAVEVAARAWPGVKRAALIGHGGAAVLAVEGDAAHAAGWQQLASGIGPITVRTVAAVPLDARHRSKVDYAALRRLLA